MKKQIAVIGLGRFGSSVARALYDLGHDVLALDKSEDKVQSMMGQVTYPVTGDAANESVLRELGISEYDVAIVSIGSDITSSIMASMLLKTLGVGMVVSRAHNELHANALGLIGVDKVVHVEAEMGSRLAHNLFNPNVQEYIEVAPNYGIIKLRAPNRFVNMSLKELGLKSPGDRHAIAVLAIKRGKDNITLNPDADDRLQAGDELVVAGKDEHLESWTSA